MVSSEGSWNSGQSPTAEIYSSKPTVCRIDEKKKRMGMAHLRKQLMVKYYVLFQPIVFMLSKTVHLKADLLHRENSSEIELNGGGGRRDIREQNDPKSIPFLFN